jgi:hypothetical protein
LRRRLHDGAAAAIVAAILLSAGTAAADEVTRFAVIAGNNIGLASAEPLKYAERDAQRMAGILSEIGGVAPGNLSLLEGAGPDALRRAMDDVASRAQTTKGDTVFVFYYSGHADSGWLRMGGRGISISELRKRLELMPTKVRIAIVDACQSGAITRSKGGKVVSPFMDEKPVDVEGLVILTSASAAEPAQESDVLRSSFFSHHLMSGLRGPADATGDGTVSAVEAYEYAYRFTVQETEGTSGGAQHPTFLYALEGQGDVTLTAVREGRARTELAPGLDGTVMFVGAGGQIDAEVVKRRGEQMTVALVPGEYEVRWRDARSLWSANVSLADGDVRILDQSSFVERPIAAATSKGGEEPAADEKQDTPEGGSPRPLDDTPLGGGAKWSGDAAGPPPGSGGAVAADEDDAVPGEIVTGPVADGASRPLGRREGARLWPAASLGASLVLPGLAQGIEKRYAQAGLITGAFAAALAGSVLTARQVDEKDTDTRYGAAYGGTAAFAFAALYTYAYAAIDAFYFNTRGGPGVPDLAAMQVDVRLDAAPLLAETPDGLRGGMSYGLGVGVAVHENVVIGLRNISVYPNPGKITASLGPEISARAMIIPRLGWSASLGAIGEVHVESDADGGTPARGFSIMPYVAAGLHYFPARAWSLDFGVRGGWSFGTRRVLGDAVQAPCAFAVEYLGGLTWHH